MDKLFNINREKHSIHCRIYCSDPDAVTHVVLFGHGFAGHRDNTAAQRFARRAMEKNKGFALISFNWPCHGDDVKKLLRLEDCSAYLRLLLSYIEGRFGDALLDAYATSFGGFLVLRYLAEAGNPFRRIALRAPAVPMYEILTGTIMSGEALRRVAKGKTALVGFDRKIEIDRAFLEELKQTDLMKPDFLPYADDILILQGTKDEVVPPASVRAFAEKNLIDYVPIPDADHRFMDPRKMDRAIAEILRFLDLR